jgi:mono/diheme cytochrome c family protein
MLTRMASGGASGLPRRSLMTVSLALCAFFAFAHGCSSRTASSGAGSEAGTGGGAPQTASPAEASAKAAGQAPSGAATRERAPSDASSSADSSAQASPQPAPVEALSYEARLGKGVYRHYCQTCHGESGAGDGFNAFNLDPRPRDLSDPAFQSAKSDADLADAIRRGGAGVGLSALMPPWGHTLSAQQIADVILYVRSLRKPPAAS